MAKDIGKGTFKCSEKDTAIERAKGTARRTVKCTAENQGKVQKKLQIKIQLEVGYFAYLCIEKNALPNCPFLLFSKISFQSRESPLPPRYSPYRGSKGEIKLLFKKLQFLSFAFKRSRSRKT